MAGASEQDRNAATGLGTRLLWFAGLWLAGVAAIGLLALLIRAALPA